MHPSHPLHDSLEDSPPPTPPALPPPTQLTNKFISTMGVDVGHVDVLVSVRLCLGYVRHVDGSVQKQYSDTESQYPLQVRRRRAVIWLLVGMPIV